MTLKTEATKPAAINNLQQQMRFDTFVHRFNHERPRQALEQMLRERSRGAMGLL